MQQRHAKLPTMVIYEKNCAGMKRYIIGITLSGLLLFVLLQGASLFREAEQKAVLLEKIRQSPGLVPKFTHADLRDGDIVFHQSLSAQSEAIQLATHAVYTHCGIIYKMGNGYFVFEAVEPVKLTPLAEWMGRGKGGDYKVKRLKTADTVFTDALVQKMKKLGEQYSGRHYDPFFEWSDDRMYCPELVWKLYKELTGLELGRLQELKDFDLTNQAVQKKLEERFGKKIPMHQPVISPVSIYESPLLKTVE